ncbi:hypothetical protein V6N13_077147 [Hibiscus sabdariffa]
MIVAAETELKSEMKSKLKLAEKKGHFIMCWVHEQPGDEAWSSLAAIVSAEKSSLMEYGRQQNFSQNREECGRKQGQSVGGGNVMVLFGIENFVIVQ